MPGGMPMPADGKAPRAPPMVVDFVVGLGRTVRLRLGDGVTEGSPLRIGPPSRGCFDEADPDPPAIAQTISTVHSTASAETATAALGLRRIQSMVRSTTYQRLG